MSQKKPKFNIELITEKDTEEVNKFALEYFHKDEPIAKSLGLLYCEESKEFIISPIPEHCSFKAVNEQGTIIGLVISGITKRPSPDEVDKAEKESENEKLKKLRLFINHCAKQWNIFDLYPNANVILDGKILAVDPKYRGLGIAGELIGKCRDYMREHHIPVMRRVCTSQFSARVMEKIGMKEVHKLRYEDFKVNGEVLLKPAAPHVACISFVMEI